MDSISQLNLKKKSLESELAEIKRTKEKEEKELLELKIRSVVVKELASFSLKSIISDIERREKGRKKEYWRDDKD